MTNFMIGNFGDILSKLQISIITGDTYLPISNSLMYLSDVLQFALKRGCTFLQQNPPTCETDKCVTTFRFFKNSMRFVFWFGNNCLCLGSSFCFFDSRFVNNPLTPSCFGFIANPKAWQKPKPKPGRLVL